MIMVRRLAVFGLGRIGALHLKNLRWNPRSEIIYCVDESVERMEYIKHHLKLKETLFLKPSQADIVFQDESIDCILQLVLKSLHSGEFVCLFQKTNGDFQ
nr:uncharacterized protein LOC107444112 isoform X2 [Parasteatoda tepidariorum]